LVSRTASNPGKQSRTIRVRRVVLWHLLTFLFASPLPAQDPLLPVLHFKSLALESYKGIVCSPIVRDRNGFIWFGTQFGLFRFDGYEYKQHRHDPNDPHTLPDNGVISLRIDSRGWLWVGTSHSGPCLYDPVRDRFVRITLTADDTSHDKVIPMYDIMEDRSGNIWVTMPTSPGRVTRIEVPLHGGSEDIEALSRRFRLKVFSLDSAESDGYTLCERGDGKIILGTNGGLCVIDPETGTITRPHLSGGASRRLDSAVVTTLLQRADGTTWAGTAAQGLFAIDWGTGRTLNYRHNRADSLSLRIDEIWNLAEDRQGNLWVGTPIDLELFSPATGKRIPYLTVDAPPRVVYGITFSYDNTGTFWIGSGFNIYWLSPRSRLFQNIGVRDRLNYFAQKEPGVCFFATIRRAPNGELWGIADGSLVKVDVSGRTIRKAVDLFHGQVVSKVNGGPGSSFIDTKGNFWYAAWDLGVFRINLASREVRNFRFSTKYWVRSQVGNVAPGSGDSLWIGTSNAGSFRMDPVTGTFTRADFEHSGTIMQGRGGILWKTGLDGLTRLDPASGATEHFFHVPADSHSLSPGFATRAYEDPQGRIWVGAGDIVNLLNPATRSFTRFANPAFSNEITHPLCSDSRGRLWLTYNRGIAILDPSTGEFINIGYDDGLCMGVSGIEDLHDGRMLISGWAGLNIVYADSIVPDRTPPTLVITRMTINDEPVIPPAVTSGSPSLRLEHTQNVLEVEFAAYDYDGRGPVRYHYQLEGLDKNWVSPESRRFVRYAGLPPGEYVLRIKASSAWDRWPDQQITMSIDIAPPWWKTFRAYAVYALLFAGLLLTVYRIRFHQLHLRQQVEMEHFQRERLEEVDHLKSRFFANISHEFRTPLTLILGTTEQVMTAPGEASAGRKLMQVKENAWRLLGLVNQLLDVSRLEAHAMKLRVTPADIVRFVQRTVDAFESSAEAKKISLEFRPDIGTLQAFFDADKLGKILNNLLSNAFKFTQGGGSVTVKLFTALRTQLPPHGGDQQWVAIAVEDTGTGISAEHVPHVFERFYRVEDSHRSEGTGIGLALTRELVALHHGTIILQSTPGKGSVFTVTLPIEGSAYQREEHGTEPDASPEINDASAVHGIPGSVNSPATPPANGKPSVLVVEDNMDLRGYVCELLLPEYRVLEAGNGAEGFDRAVDTVPDLVISDVMMPVMDGMELCRSLKHDTRTSHIPVILLTARAGTENKMEGLDTGADDYVTKPFEAKELVARVRNLIQQRRLLRERFSASVELKPGEVTWTSLDDDLLKKALAFVEEHLGDENLSADDIAVAVTLSRRHLDRKLMGLTNLSGTEFIWHMRLQRAYQMLEKNTATIAEIAYRTGFKNPSHFSTSFHERFGCPPSRIRGEKA
jgi:signal transduction histidine kinase/DNA-binding response OmpR family regulator/ligand-binding sensor domain-containing protein